MVDSFFARAFAQEEGREEGLRYILANRRFVH